MTREEMLKRLKAGEDPLDLSIEKWKDIVEHLNQISKIEEYNKELQQGANNCALCEVYGYSYEHCPVYIATKGMSCRNTPYPEFVSAEYHGLLNKMKIKAKEELEFLKSLKKQKD